MSGTFELVDGDALLARLGEWWQDPPRTRYGGRPRRIAGGPYDQPVPQGVGNPYWEIVRQLPLDEFSVTGPYPSSRPEPTGHVFTAADGFEYLADRHALCATYSWAIPSPGAVAWIVQRLGGQGLVETGAGGGYWAWQLSQAGADVVAYDPSPPPAKFALREWHSVLRDDASATAHHPDRALLLCWPSYSEPWAAHALSCYKGDRLFYIGESKGGCCADDDFFELLYEEWEEAGECPQHISWWGIHDYLTEYQRKG